MMRSLMMILVTGVLIMVLSYQPPLRSIAQPVLMLSMDTTVSSECPLDTISLMDSLELYKLKMTKDNKWCAKAIAILRDQQGVLVHQQKTLDTLTSITKSYNGKEYFSTGKTITLP